MIKLPKIYGGWQYFESLDHLYGVRGVFTLAWRFIDDEQEPWTRRLRDFKFGNGSAVPSAASVLTAAIPEIFGPTSWKYEESGIVAALSSPDTVTDPHKSLPRLAKACGEQLNLKFLPQLLSKKPHRSLHKISAGERSEELRKAMYQANAVALTPLKRIFVLDDLVTTGETLSTIAGAIHKVEPTVDVFGIALGKNERKSYAEGTGNSISNDHVPAEWATKWDDAHG